MKRSINKNTPTGQAPLLIKYKETKKLNIIKIEDKKRRLLISSDRLGYSIKSKYFFFFILINIVKNLFFNRIFFIKTVYKRGHYYN